VAKFKFATNCHNICEKLVFITAGKHIVTTSSALQKAIKSLTLLFTWEISKERNLSVSQFKEAAVTT